MRGALGSCSTDGRAWGRVTASSIRESQAYATPGVTGHSWGSDPIGTSVTRGVRIRGQADLLIYALCVWPPGKLEVRDKRLGIERPSDLGQHVCDPTAALE